MTPVVSASRAVSDSREASSPVYMRPPIKNDPMTLAANVPYGNALPSSFDTQPTSKYRAPPPTALPKHTQKSLNMFRSGLSVAKSAGGCSRLCGERKDGPEGQASRSIHAKGSPEPECSLVSNNRPPKPA